MNKEKKRLNILEQDQGSKQKKSELKYRLNYFRLPEEHQMSRLVSPSQPRLGFTVELSPNALRHSLYQLNEPSYASRMGLTMYHF